MSRFLRRHPNLNVIILTLGIVFALIYGPYPAGGAAALVENALGKPAIYAYGQLGGHHFEYFGLLEKRQGVRTRLIMTGRLSIFHIRYAEGYNAVSRALPKRRFGRDIFEECFEEAFAEVMPGLPGSSGGGVPELPGARSGR